MAAARDTNVLTREVVRQKFLQKLLYILICIHFSCTIQFCSKRMPDLMSALPNLAQNADLHQKLDDKNRELASRHILLLKVREKRRVQYAPANRSWIFEPSWRLSYPFACALAQARNALEELEASSAENERRAESEAASLAGAHLHTAAIQT